MSESNNCLINLCRFIVFHPKFDTFIVVSIVLNTVVLGMTHYDESEDLKKVLAILNGIFMVIFALEAMIKIIAQGKAYFRDGWNKFDFTIIVLAVLLSIPMSFGMLTEYQNLTTTIRVLRVARMFRLFVKAQKLSIIF